ncbi:ADP-ribosylation factor protein 3 [Pseudocyphellaria aurata]|nr:ADP-ribosylation factor protein 3 [Pseudocyphellaria aurata]
MYHLAKSLYLYATSKEEYSILLLGLDNAGKTTLLSSIKSLYLPHHPETSSKTVPTVGQNVSTIDLPDMYLKIWDVGGQHALRNLWTRYYSSCHAIVFVVDSSDIGDGELSTLQANSNSSSAFSHPTKDNDDDDNNEIHNPTSIGGTNPRDDESLTTGRLAECKLVLESVLASSSTVGVPILVLANKQDREDCVETVRIKEGLVRPVFEGEKGDGVRDSRVLPVSALKGTGVGEAVEWIRSRVKWNREGRPPVMR